MPGKDPFLPGLERRTIDIGNGVQILAAGDGCGPPLLLLHGHPQTHATWHSVASLLASAGDTVVASDLRGYGDSFKPDGGVRYGNYSNSAMASDQVTFM